MNFVFDVKHLFNINDQDRDFGNFFFYQCFIRNQNAVFKSYARLKTEMEHVFYDLANVSLETFKNHCQSNFYKFKINQEKMASHANLQCFQDAVKITSSNILDSNTRHAMIYNQSHCGNHKHAGQWTEEEMQYLIKVLKERIENDQYLIREKRFLG